jgi:hypothetical protein
VLLFLGQFLEPFGFGLCFSYIFSVLGLEVQAFQIPIVVYVEGVIYVITLEHQVTFQHRKLALN